MPIVHIEIDQRRIEDPDIVRRLIDEVTTGVGAVLGDDIARFTEVIVVPRRPEYWAVGGRALASRPV